MYCLLGNRYKRYKIHLSFWHIGTEITTDLTLWIKIFIHSKTYWAIKVAEGRPKICIKVFCFLLFLFFFFVLLCFILLFITNSRIVLRPAVGTGVIFMNSLSVHLYNFLPKSVCVSLWSVKCYIVWPLSFLLNIIWFPLGSK